MLHSNPVPPTTPKVLIVDDQPANRLALEAVLQELGAELVLASSGTEALMRTLQDDFAAILLDVRMPGMDGFEAARLIRSRARSRGTPILFVTAVDSAEPYLEDAYALGAVDFLTKPLQPAVLKGKVAFFIELQRSREELRQAERQAVNERAFLAAVLDAVQDGIVACDAQGRLTLFNRATREIHGMPMEPLPSERWAEHYRLFRPDGHTPLAPHEPPLARALAGEQVHDADLVVESTDGQRRILVSSGQPLQDTATGNRLGAVVSMHDVTAQREAEAARELALREQARREAAEALAERLRVSEERYRTLFESMDEGFCVIELIYDAQGQPIDYRYLEANPTFAKHTGLGNVVGRRMLELVPEIPHPWMEAFAEVPRPGEPKRMLHHWPRHDRWFDVGATRVAGSDTRLALLGSGVTERVHAEARLRRLAAKLAESDRRKTEFLATLAHELRNPLAPLRNGLYLLRQSRDAAAQLRAGEMMERQLGHMVRLVDDLLDIARVSSGKVELKKETIELHQLIDSAVETSQPLIEQVGHTLAVDLPAQSLWLEVDPTRIAQVLANLLSNAAKYTPAGGHLRIAAQPVDGEVAICVEDNGIGIDAKALPRVFEMFTQVGRESQHAPGGLGIGLALVRALVEMHGGSIKAESEGPGHGSRFTVTLPLATPPEAADEAKPEASMQGSLNVLVVDDNQDAAESLALILQMDGHVARVAHDGPSAVELAAQFQPQVVFLDIGMPGMDGYEVARRLRRQPGAQPVLVALTGWGTQEDLARATEAGFDHHLTKPADIGAVERLLASLSTTA